ncbi:methyl-accepting chemotaxis protein [Desulfovibrio inopinatus]|uniref:methyl-accepting chemotaxis protein n=1 Tax=Desulfovibrio inopinatus TaxID=102109 RepID=UPI0004267F42|nr:methyl-accepting chemotaxis protein [Desulfovibrio inopinatus]
MFVVDRVGIILVDSVNYRESLMSEAALDVLQSRRQEKNFLIRHDADSLQKAEAAIARIGTQLDSIARDDPDMAGTIKTILVALQSYSEAFTEVSRADQAMGKLDSGLEHDFVMAARKLEEAITSRNNKDLLIALLQLRRQEKNFILRGEALYSNRVLKYLTDLKSSFPANDSVSPLLQAYRSYFTKYIDQHNELVLQADHLIQAGRRLETLVVNLRKVYEEQHDTLVTRVDRIGVILEGSTVAIVIAMILWIIAGINSSLGALRSYSAAVARGELTAKPHGDFHGELAELRNDITAMVSSLDEKMRQVLVSEEKAKLQAEKADQASAEANSREHEVRGLFERMQHVAGRVDDIARNLAGSAVGLTEQAENVAQGAMMQKDRVTETATAMEEMSATVFEIARNAGSAASAAESTRHNAVQGLLVADEAGKAMQQVNTIAQGLQSEMTGLSKNAESVGQVIDVINEIADQTNLLALNAAIEAARAGDAGRGFAVVADEVRKLAEKTMAATKEVAERVHAIQSATKRNQEGMDSAISAVDEANRLVVASSEALNKISQFADDAAGQAQSIAAASQQQSAATEQINRAVDAVNLVASETADGMKDALDALHHLTRTAEDLHELTQELNT